MTYFSGIQWSYPSLDQGSSTVIDTISSLHIGKGQCSITVCDLTRKCVSHVHISHCEAPVVIDRNIIFQNIAGIDVVVVINIIHQSNGFGNVEFIRIGCNRRLSMCMVIVNSTISITSTIHRAIGIRQGMELGIEAIVKIHPYCSIHINTCLIGDLSALSCS